MTKPRGTWYPTSRNKGYGLTGSTPTDFPLPSRSVPMRTDGSWLSGRTGSLDSRSIRAVWYRRQVDPDFPFDVEARFAEFGVREARAHLTGALLSLSNVQWVSHPASLWAAEKKPYQLSMASSLGFDLPATRISNDAEVAREFANGRSLVAKAVSSGYIRSEIGYDAIFTSAVSDEDIDDLEGLSLAPVIFQELLRKQADIRVTVVGDQVFGTEILSQEHASSKTDWASNPLGRPTASEIRPAGG